jgi:hypothetical protein
MRNGSDLIVPQPDQILSFRWLLCLQTVGLRQLLDLLPLDLWRALKRGRPRGNDSFPGPIDDLKKAALVTH